MKNYQIQIVDSQRGNTSHFGTGIRISDQKKFQVRIFQSDLIQKNSSKFLKEGKIISGIRHEELLEYIDCFIENDKIFFIMEDLGWPNLKNIQLNEQKVLEIIVKILKGLSYLHSRDIPHGCLKLENILIKNQNEVKLQDFGFSKFLEFFNSNDIDNDSFYLCPEILLNEPFSFKSDIWSVGVIAFYLFSQNIPFQSEIFNQLKDLIIDGEPEPAFQKLNISRFSKSILTSCLNKSPNFRPSSQDLLRSIERYLNDFFYKDPRAAILCAGSYDYGSLCDQSGVAEFSYLLNQFGFLSSLIHLYCHLGVLSHSLNPFKDKLFSYPESPVDLNNFIVSNTTLHSNNAVTPKNFIQTINSLLNSPAVKTLLIIYTNHGDIDTLMFPSSTIQKEFLNPQELANLFNQIENSKKHALFLIDACSSGAFVFQALRILYPGHTKFRRSKSFPLQYISIFYSTVFHETTISTKIVVVGKQWIIYNSSFFRCFLLNLDQDSSSSLHQFYFRLKNSRIKGFRPRLYANRKTRQLPLSYFVGQKSTPTYSFPSDLPFFRDDFHDNEKILSYSIALDVNYQPVVITDQFKNQSSQSLNCIIVLPFFLFQ